MWEREEGVNAEFISSRVILQHVCVTWTYPMVSVVVSHILQVVEMRNVRKRKSYFWKQGKGSSNTTKKEKKRRWDQEKEGEREKGVGCCLVLFSWLKDKSLKRNKSRGRRRRERRREPGEGRNVKNQELNPPAFWMRHWTTKKKSRGQWVNYFHPSMGRAMLTKNRQASIWVPAMKGAIMVAGRHCLS